MADQPDPEKLAALGKKIAALKAAQTPERAAQSQYAKAGQGWRMVIELVVGVIMGFGIGYGLDSLFGTLPIFLVLFIMLGFAAGLRVMLQTAAEMDKKGQKPEDE
jgi:ATP synthase protein I